MALRQVAADLLAIFRIAVIEHYLPAVATGRLDLHRRRVGRHYDGRRDPQQARREGDGLGVVAGGERHHPGGTLLGGKPRQRVEGAAELERSHALQVFAFEEDFRAEFFVEGTRGHHRRAVGMPGDPRGGGDHIVVGRQVVHGRFLERGKDDWPAPRAGRMGETPVRRPATRLPVGSRQQSLGERIAGAWRAKACDWFQRTGSPDRSVATGERISRELLTGLVC